VLIRAKRLIEKGGDANKFVIKMRTLFTLRGVGPYGPEAQKDGKES